MKLQTKLILAFIAVVLFMGVFQSFFLQTRIKSTFQNYLQQYNFGFMNRMEQMLELYYEQTGSWDHVQELFFAGNPSNGQGHGMMKRGMFMKMAMANADLLLLDSDGKVIADTAGTRIGMNGKQFTGNTKDLIVNGEKKGTLVLYRHELQNLEKEFIRSANASIMISGLIATVLAVLFGILIARKIADPMRKLLDGIKRIASGEKSSAVNITTKDEFYELGSAFNEMAKKLIRNEEIRQALVADVAHELRTPLAILQGKLESIQEGVAEASEEMILELADEVYRLNRLVSDLQQLSLVDAGKLPLNKQPTNMKKLIDRVCGHLEWLAEEKGIVLEYHQIPSGSELSIDADRITQVLVNLIGNALRHTPKDGKVVVSAEEKNGAFVLKFSDTGEGIPEVILPHIFDRFYKRDPSRTRGEGEGGTGLGLSIAKGFVEAHGGTISAESEVGKGTVFTVILPIEKN
jgi:two-component system sensor histidine kinase BaeS